MRWTPFSGYTVIAFCCVFFGSSARGAEPATDKNAFRYDGKPFEYWRDYLRTELKAERRVDAIRAMGAFGIKGRPREATQAIVELMKDLPDQLYYGDKKERTPDQDVHFEAVAAIKKMGEPALDVLIQNSANAHIRYLTSHAFSLVDSNDKGMSLSPTALRLLIEAVEGEDRAIRNDAIGLLALAVDRGESFPKRLIAALGTGDSLERFLTALEKSLADRTERDFSTAILLKVLGPRAKSAAPALARAIVKYRVYSGEEALKAMEVDLVALIPVIEEGLRSSDANEKKRAAEWLGNIGPKAETAVPAILHAIHEFVQPPAERFESGKPELTFVRSVDDPEREVLLELIKALGSIGASPDRVVPALAVILADPKQSQAVRLAAIDALAKFGSRGRGAGTALANVISNEEESADLRYQALGLVAKIGGEPRVVLSALLHVIDEESNTNLLERAIKGMGALGNGAADGVPVLIRAFKELKHCQHHRPLIAQALGQIGPTAKEALPLLREAAQSSDRALRKTAIGAVEKIEGKNARP